MLPLPEHIKNPKLDYWPDINSARQVAPDGSYVGGQFTGKAGLPPTPVFVAKDSEF